MMSHAPLAALVALDPVPRMLGHIEPTAVIDPHRNGPPEALFGLQVRRTLTLGGHIRTRLDEVPGPRGEGGVTMQRGQMRAIRPQDLHSFVAPVGHDDV